MLRPRSLLEIIAVGALAMLTLGAATVPAAAEAVRDGEFVTRVGSKLTLNGAAFRYSGPNIEWLGLEAYGPHDPMGPRYPSHFEVDDALDTAVAMGARVVRAQTLGDSVGCALCIEPSPGKFNPSAFNAIDYAIKAAHDRGLRLIILLVGDCAACDLRGEGQYVQWTGGGGIRRFFEDPKTISIFQAHIAAILNHKNALTGVAYKNDPTIMGWENCNLCAYDLAFSDPKGGMSSTVSWVDKIGSFIKSIDRKHLYVDNSGAFLFDPRALDAATSDIVTSEYYPHWDALMGTGHKTTADIFPEHANAVTAHGKVYVVNEFGWDVTDWPTQQDLLGTLHKLEDTANISGDLYWALQAHNDNFGWQPIPADVENAAYAKMGETGQWWALYYGGRSTLVNTKDDMRQRAELLRDHAYRMGGFAIPPHTVPPAPTITLKGAGILGWRGSAGAVAYTIERQSDPNSSWQTVCDKCATDEDAPWIDRTPFSVTSPLHYRVTAYNADGVASEPSAVR